jgi:hypothetical protein
MGRSYARHSVCRRIMTSPTMAAPQALPAMEVESSLDHDSFRPREDTPRVNS